MNWFVKYANNLTNTGTGIAELGDFFRPISRPTVRRTVTQSRGMAVSVRQKTRSITWNWAYIHGQMRHSPGKCNRTRGLARIYRLYTHAYCSTRPLTELSSLHSGWFSTRNQQHTTWRKCSRKITTSATTTTACVVTWLCDASMLHVVSRSAFVR